MAKTKLIVKPTFKTPEEKQAYIELQMKEMNKKYGMDVIHVGDEEKSIEKIPTGIKELDELLGGGIARGRFTVFWGSSKSGKSTSAYYLTANAQKLGLKVYYIALEPFDKERAELFGVDLSPECKNKILIGKFPIAEQSLDSITDFARKELVDVIVLDSIHCYDKETMILTNIGWKYFYELTGEELVLSLNRDLNNADYYPIKNIIKSQYRGKLVLYEGKHTNFCSTLNNKFLYGSPSYKYKFSGWNIAEIQKIREDKKYNYHLLKKNFNWVGQELTDIILEGKKRSDKPDIVTFKLPIDIWLQFLGWFISEGSLAYKKPSNRTKKDYYVVNIHQSRKSPFLNEIENIFKQLPFKYSIYKFKDEVTYTIHNVILGRYLAKIAGKNAENKKIPEYIRSASIRQIKLLLDAYIKGDGYICWNGNTGATTKSKQLALDLKELYLKIGVYVSLIVTNIEKQRKWIVDHWSNVGGVFYNIKTYSNNNMTHLIKNKNIKEIDYNDYVYDVEVNSPTHLIYLMRKGTSYWGSNSLSPKREQEEKSGEKKSLEKENMALLAAKLSQWFRTANDPIQRSKVAVLLIGQTRTNIGGFVALDQLSGGNSLLHYSRLIAHFRRGKGSDAPTKKEKITKIIMNEDDEEETKTVTEERIIGFNCVIKLDKVQIQGAKPELSEINIPYLFNSGFSIIQKEDTTPIKEEINLTEKKKRGRPKNEI